MLVLMFVALVTSAKADLVIKNTQKHGYRVKLHSVVTADGYFLKVHQIPSSSGQTKGSVLLVHGILSSGSSFTYRKQSLAFVLADAGYDVWIYNGRGTVLSTKHKKYSERMKEYWNFSLHEIGVYDLPATVDYVLSHNQNKPLNMVGYSQGGPVALIFLSMLPHYNKKIENLYLLAPVVYMDKRNHEPIDLFASLNSHKYDLTDAINALFLRQFCFKHMEICGQVFQKFVGKAEHFVVKDQFPKLLGYVDNFSVKMVKHYSQINHSNRFQQFDYGYKENRRLYGSSKPPIYDLSKVTAPTKLFHGTHDLYFNPTVLKRLKSSLPNLQESTEVPYNHFDFFMAKDLYKYLNSKIVESLDKSLKNRYLSNYIFG